MSMVCKCDHSALFPRCDRNPEHCIKDTDSEIRSQSSIPPAFIHVSNRLLEPYLAYSRDDLKKNILLILDQLLLFIYIYIICVIERPPILSHNPPFCSTWSPYACIFQGFCQYPRKWHIWPILSRLLGHINMLRKRRILPTILTDLDLII